MNDCTKHEFYGTTSFVQSVFVLATLFVYFRYETFAFWDDYHDVMVKTCTLLDVHDFNIIKKGPVYGLSFSAYMIDL